MNLTCNIDRRGQRVRYLIGAVNVLLGVGLLLLAYAMAWLWAWIVGTCAVAGGAFALFEARQKWCAVRAIGLKTPL